MSFSKGSESGYAHKRRIFLWIFSLGFIFLACSLSAEIGDGRQETLTSIGVLQTMLSYTSEALSKAGTGSAQGYIGMTETWSAISSEAPGINVTMTTTPLSTVVPGGVEVDERLLKSAKILLFEDMSASTHIRYVKEALDRAGYFYQDVGSATGWFKTQLNSDVEWDLVIAAAEARRVFGGEFFEYIDKQVARGAGAIVEYWDVDAAPLGRVKPLLDRCGVELQSDWFDPEMRVFFWLVPDHPVFNQPNVIKENLGNAQVLWLGDIGDLMQVKFKNGQPVGDAVLLAGTNSNWKTDHGTLVSCLGGRVIIQTFGSHEYQYYNVVQLWQNYIYQTLKNHFIYTKASIPTPAITSGPTLEATSTSIGETPGPSYLSKHGCGDVFTVRLIDAPRYEKDLFEHHADGTFLILRFELINETPYPIQVWDEDYFVEGNLQGEPVIYSPHKAATGFLYIDSPTNLYQDLIDAGETWRSIVVFDVDPNTENLTFLFKPGSEFNEQVCEISIPLNR